LTEASHLNHPCRDPCLTGFLSEFNHLSDFEQRRGGSKSQTGKVKTALDHLPDVHFSIRKPRANKGVLAFSTS
jgi:hypothetical protein